MKKTIFLILALAISTAMYAQTGSWIGELDIQGTKLPLVFNLSAEESTMDSPKQGVRDIKVEYTPNEQGNVVISIPAIHAKYEGKCEGDEIIGTFTQSGMTLTLNLKPGEVEKPKRPQTPVSPFPYTTEEVQFYNETVQLNGTLTIPLNCNYKKTPLVVLVTGSGQQNRDEELFEHKPFAVIADAFARKGIATLRYDDRFYENKAEIFSNYTTQDFQQDALAAINFARKRFERVGVLGHSEGGTIALLLAAEGKTDFIISMAGMVRNGKETILKQNEVMLTKTGLPSDIVSTYCTALQQGFEGIIDGKQPEELSRPNNLPEVLTNNFETAMKQASTPWFRYFLTLDASKVLNNIKCPVLALNGKSDTQVDCTDNLNLLKKGLKQKHVKIVALDNLNHLFQHCQTGMVVEYEEIEETIAPEALEIMTTWISAIKK